MTDTKAPVEDPNTPVEECKSSELVPPPQGEEKDKEEEKPIEVLPSVLDKRLQEAFQKGSNMLYSELIGYLFVQAELFANQFKPQNATFENFLGFVLHTLGQEYNKKYVKQEEPKDGKEKEDGQHPKSEEEPPEGQGQDKAEPQEGEEAPKERCEDVQGRSEGGQEVNQEAECKEEVKGE